MNYVEELNPLIGKISEQTLFELNIFFINCDLSKEDRKKLVSILLKF
jgi:hypothetical protein